MRITLAALACVFAFSSAAYADDCKPLQVLATFPLTPFGPVFTMPITLNGVQKQFLFDTGGGYWQVSSTVADELKLRRDSSRLRMFSTDGQESDTYTRIADLKLGGLSVGHADLPVSSIQGFDGIFTPLMFKADFDVDFVARKVNMISSDHCDGKVVYWPSKGLAVVNIRERDRHLTVPVTLDGHDFTAIIDTGATTSVLRMDMAHRAFGLSPDSPGMQIAGHINGNNATMSYNYPFKTLSFEGITVNNPRIHILEDYLGRKARGEETGSHLLRSAVDAPELMVGMDVLRKLHMYLAQKEGKLYLTEASAPVTASASIVESH